MGTPIHCDADACDRLADVIVSNLANGDTTAYCAGHFPDFCRVVAEAADAEERASTDAAAEAALADVAAPEASIDPATVVRRGTSRSRQAFEARKRAKAAAGVTAGPDDDEDEPEDG